MGWFSKIEQPLVRDLSIACWRLFSDLDLSRGAQDRVSRACTIALPASSSPGLRPPDPDPSIVVSPCDAIIGAFGAIADTELFQIKGAPYSLLDLLGDPALVEAHRNGRFITLRLTSSMYHRFHAPHDCRIEQVDVHQRRHLERQSDRAEADREAVLQERARGDQDPPRHRRGADAGAGRGHSGRQHPAAFSRSSCSTPQSRGPVVFPCDVSVRKGDELGWFEHGSTIIVLAPENFEFCDNVVEAARIRAGEPLLRKRA